MANPLAVLGAGVMGVGIAALAVGHGLPVVLIDIDEHRLECASALVSQQVRMAQLLGALDRDRLPGELVISNSVWDIAGAGAVIEAITEVAVLKAVLKAEVLADASAAVAPGTVLMSNTSGIPIYELATSVARPEDLVGAHFMNPPYLIPTVEVVRGERSGDHALRAATSLLGVLGREPVVVNDGPGFVSSRILHRMINDAAQIVAEGRASAEAVDTLMNGCGHRTGPLRTADLIGLDNLVDSLRALHIRTGDDAFRPCELLLEKVAAGDHGRKTGRGFYEYAEAF